MHLLRRLFLATALFLPATAHAAAPDAPATSPLSSEHRLSNAEIDQVLDTAARKRETTEELSDKPGREIHGEVGVAIGTGGYRSVYGTALVPILSDGVAILSFESTDFGKQRGWGYRR